MSPQLIIGRTEDPARTQRRLWRFMASKTKVTPQKEEMLEKEGAFVNLKTKKR